MTRAGWNAVTLVMTLRGEAWAKINDVSEQEWNIVGRDESSPKATEFSPSQFLP